MQPDLTASILGALADDRSVGPKIDCVDHRLTQETENTGGTTRQRLIVLGRGRRPLRDLGQTGISSAAAAAKLRVGERSRLGEDQSSTLVRFATRSTDEPHCELSHPPRARGLMTHRPLRTEPPGTYSESHQQHMLGGFVKALVTGVAGFIGSTLATELLKDTANIVLGIDSFTEYYDVEMKRSNARALKGERFRLIEEDLCRCDLDELLADVDVIFHLAGQPGVRKSWGSDFGHYIRQNIDATQKLLEASKRSASLKRFVNASSSSVYGDAERFPTQESDRPMPRSPYGVTKLAAENLCSLYAANFDVPTVSLRYFTVYGPKQRPDMAFHRFTRAAIEQSVISVYGDGTQIREFTYVQDIVRANMLAATRDVVPGSILNLSGGSSVSVIDVLETLAEISGRELNVQNVAPIPGDVFRTGGSSQLAESVLGWKPQVQLRDGLDAEFRWMQGYLRG